MVTLQQWKEKLIEILDDVFYLKTEIDEKENVLNESIAEKLNISDAFSGDYNDLINKPNSSSTITIICNEKNATDNGIYILKECGSVVTTIDGDSVHLGTEYDDQWLNTIGDVVIDWGDGTSDTVNNPTTMLSHTYTDGKSKHDITFIGTVTGLGAGCFDECAGLTNIIIPDSVTSLGEKCFQRCTGLTSITIPNSVTSISGDCFWGCTGLTSVTIPNSVTSLGTGCFWRCSALVDYQLYWTGNNIITYNSNKMPNNTNTAFTIPYGETANYVNAGYPSDKLQERSE